MFDRELELLDESTPTCQLRTAHCLRIDAEKRLKARHQLEFATYQERTELLKSVSDGEKLEPRRVITLHL